MTRFILLAGIVALAGCSDETTSPLSSAAASGPGSSSSSGAGGGGGSGGAAGGKVEVRVTTVDAELAEHPAVGAAVALDAAGARVEQTVDADGKATFSGVDFSADDVDVIAALAGYGFGAVGRVQPDAGEIALRLRPALVPEIQVSGMAIGMPAPAHKLVVTASVAGSTDSEENGAGYSLQVPKDTAFNLVALEREDLPPASPRGQASVLHQWTTASSAALTADAMVTLDFAGPGALPSLPYSGTFPDAAGTSHMATNGIGFITVRLANGSSDTAADDQSLGQSSTIDIPANSRTFEYTGEYVDAAGGGLVITRYGLADGPFAKGGVQIEGPPTENATLDLEPPVPPRKVPPGSQSIDAPLAWEPEYQDDETNFIVRITGTNGSFSYVIYPPDSTSGVIPKLPSTVDPATILGTGGLQATLGLCGPPYIKNLYCTKFATGEQFALGQ